MKRNTWEDRKGIARPESLPSYGALNYYIPNVRFFAQHFLDTSCKSLVAKELRAVANVPKNWLFGSGYAGLGTAPPTGCSG